MNSLIANLASGILLLLIGALVSPELFKKYWYLAVIAVLSLLYLANMFRKNDKIVQSNRKSPLETGTWDLRVKNIKIEKNSYEFFGDTVAIKAKFVFPYGFSLPEKICVSLPFAPNESKNIYISLDRHKIPIEIHKGVSCFSMPVAGNATVVLEAEYNTLI